MTKIIDNWMPHASQVTIHKQYPCSFVRAQSHVQTQFQDDYRLIFSWPFFYVSFSSFTFPSAPYQILFLYLPRLPSHFFLVVIEQQQQLYLHTENSILYLMKLNPNQIVYWTIFQLIWNQTEFHLVQSENGTYNLISV